MLELAQEKMSKSLGNIVSLRDSLDEWGAEPLLLLFLGAHYRSPVEYSDESMEAAKTQASDFRTAFRVVERSDGAPSWDDFAAALDDDFNTPLALSILHAWRSAGELELLARGLAIFGLGVEEAGAAPGRGRSSSPRPGRRPARQGTTTAPTSCGRRSTLSDGRSRTFPKASG